MRHRFGQRSALLGVSSALGLLIMGPIPLVRPPRAEVLAARALAEGGRAYLESQGRGGRTSVYPPNPPALNRGFFDFPPYNKGGPNEIISAGPGGASQGEVLSTNEWESHKYCERCDGRDKSVCVPRGTGLGNGRGRSRLSGGLPARVRCPPFFWFESGTVGACYPICGA